MKLEKLIYGPNLAMNKREDRLAYDPSVKGKT